MSNIFRRTGFDVPDSVRRFMEGDIQLWPRIEEYRDAGSLVVRAEMPGIDPDRDVDIALTGNELAITVRREERSEHKAKHGYRSEFRYGTATRTVTLKPGVKEEDIRATYTDGVLEIRISVPEEPAPGSRKIPVSRP